MTQHNERLDMHAGLETLLNKCEDASSRAFVMRGWAAEVDVLERVFLAEDETLNIKRMRKRT